MKTITKSHAPRYRRDGITSYLLVSKTTTGARYITTTLVEMQPGGRQHLHRHNTEQSYFILSGQGVMTVGKETKTVKTGDTVFIPSNAPHGLINAGTRILKYYSAGSPPFGKKKEPELWPIQPIKR
jgi:quercetin dioxygenase-like cupin family protein